MENVKLEKDMFKVIGKDIEKADKIVRPSMTYWQDARRRLKANKMAMLALVILSVVILFTIFAPMLSEHTYDHQDFAHKNEFSSSSHFFGTDNLGRDLWVRCWRGARVSLFIAVVATAINVTIGILYGGIAGYLGGYVDIIMMRIVEVIYSIPSMLWMILLLLVLKPGLKTIIITISATGWGGMARLVRGQVLQIKQMEFVMASKTLGASSIRVILRHLIPNAMGPIIISLTFQVPGAIFTEAMLSYLGLGIQPPNTSWGSLANAGTKMLLVFPYQLFFPALLICITMLAFNLFGDGLRDALDPRLRK
ncbi:ABC transporter permease [Clostridiaceae bacterium M8S5]|nr:ABC transporter permease [Clostridiaceae bacterium M8S5]